MLIDGILDRAQGVIVGFADILPEGTIDVAPISNVTAQMSHGVGVLFDSTTLVATVSLLLLVATAGWTFRALLWAYRKIPIVGGH